MNSYFGGRQQVGVAYGSVISSECLLLDSHGLASSLHGPRHAHCGGGTGPNQFNTLAALERWREQNEPPKSITAARVNEQGRIDMTRPLYPYPERAVYNLDYAARPNG